MTERQPHILFMTSLIADGKPSTGYEVANQAIIDALRRLGVRITVIGFSRPGGAPGKDTISLGELDPATHNASALRKAHWLAKAFAGNLPVSVAKLRMVSERAVKTAIARAGPADACLLNAVQMSAAFERVLTARKFLYVAHNVEYRSAAENADAAASRFLRMLYSREARLLQAIEERLCRNAEYIFTLADEDLAMLQAEGKGATLPLVTTSARPAFAKDRDISCDAAMIGTWTWQPNLIGLLWFLDEVLPLLPEGFSVKIAGAAPAGLASRYPRAQFVGRVPDATEFVRSGRAVPLISRAGTGVQLKTIETFELGLPSVATRHSLRGLQDVPCNCIIADDPHEFADALIRTAGGMLHDLDGGIFHGRQIQRLDLAMRKGLSAAGISSPEPQA